MGRGLAWKLILLLALGVGPWFLGCDGKGQPDAGPDATDAGLDGAGGDDDGGGDIEPDGGDPQTDGGDTPADGGDAACPQTGELNDPCTHDCDCRPGTACRGLPGQSVCALPCAAWSDCEDALPGCQSARCEMSTGACFCPCEEGDCPVGQVCHLGSCVGCAADEHCRENACSDGLVPACLLAEERCACGGACGDGDCDEAEASNQDCPADCPGPCTDGEILPHWCTSGQAVEWCTCQAGSWACIDPTPACQGETACQQAGGMCVTNAEDCYEGELAADPSGCVDPQPACCMPLACTGPGESYYPMMGLCCPGLMALPDTTPMVGWLPDDPAAVTCATNCWALHCAPCGDGVCQLHFGENFCLCPEDCPPPPYPLGCDPAMGEGCGVAWCTQDGTDCTQHRPACEAGTCRIEVSPHPDQHCSATTRSCEP